LSFMGVLPQKGENYQNVRIRPCVTNRTPSTCPNKTGPAFAQTTNCGLPLGAKGPVPY